MAADDGRSLALHVCNLCKARKKKCNKQLPRCSYCAKGDHQCVYEPLSRNRTTPAQQQREQQQQQRLPADATAPPLVIALSPTLTITPSVSTSAANLYQQVYHLIRASGSFVDDVSARYFHGLHLYVPVISRARFHDGLVTLGATPTIDFSVLLLSLHLVTLAPPTPDRHRNGGPNDTSDDQSVYLATKSLFTQVQSSSPASIHLNLIQAGLLIAFYEYTRGQPDQAFMTVSLCARLGYAARINRPVGGLSEPDHHYSTRWAQTREASNTWWGVVIYERCFQCEATTPHQPLITPMPESDAELPTEAAVLDEWREPERGAGLPGPGEQQQQQQQQQPQPQPQPQPVAQLSALEHANVGVFGRSAQAAWLLDQVLKGTEIHPNLESRLPSLRGLDEKLRAFLSQLVRQANGKRGPVCQAIAVTIRALYTLHRRILDRLAQLPISVGDQSSVQMNRQMSHAALETTTNMVLDVVEAHHGSSESSLCLAPSYPYIARAAVEYINMAHGCSENRSLLEAVGRLRRSMEHQGSHFFS
ncbi:Zn(II)2Cys6 transcription factor [Apiospora saccharicola]|uniref:Zn(II)2Cys6 transcription factor n=1 Tax=Apiospora saccharicola TaxID=335842 RepID=A0ABR1TM32_9PEZI